MNLYGKLQNRKKRNIKFLFENQNEGQNIMLLRDQNKQKGFTLKLYSFVNLEEHADHALFSPISLPANLPQLSPT